MKPITNIEEFLKRFDHFKDGEFRSIEVASPTAMLVTLSGQDSARAFDWVSMKLEFNGVSDARLLDTSKLSLVDMSNGISIIKNNNKLAFGIGECYNISNTRNSTCFILCDSLKYEEGLF
ncbi:hypothetical protein [Sulfurimonas sp.]